MPNSPPSAGHAPCREQTSDPQPNLAARSAGESLVGAVAGTLLLVAGHRRRGAAGFAAELVGAGLLVAAVAPFAERWLLASGSARRELRLNRELRVDRPVDEVFEFCRDFENFPRVLHAVESVVDYQDGRSHWTIRTPAGRTLEWDAVVTKYVPRSVIAWHSVAGSDVDTGGLVRFAPSGDGGTLIELELTYRPCATDLREAFHAMIDVPPARQIETALRRVPEYLRGRTAMRAADRAEAVRDAAAHVATSPVTPGAPRSRGPESGPSPSAA